MPVASFDFSSLLPPGLPPAAAKWGGRARYNFIGGNNDPEQTPVDGLVAAATAVLLGDGTGYLYSATCNAQPRLLQRDRSLSLMSGHPL